MLTQYGIAHDAPPRVGAAPLDGAVFWDHRSPDLPWLIRHMLVLSDNHFAEQLLRTVGSAAAQAGSDDPGGVAVERRCLLYTSIVLIARMADDLADRATLEEDSLELSIERWGFDNTRKLILMLSWFNLVNRYESACRVPIDSDEKLGQSSGPT